MKKLVLFLVAVLALAVPALAETSVITTTVTTDTKVTSPVPPAPAPMLSSAPLGYPVSWMTESYYMMLQLGSYGPSQGKYAIYDPQPGLAANLIFGKQFNPYFALQGEIGYLDSKGEAHYQFYAMPLTAAIHVGMPLLENVNIYGLFGAGAYFYKAEYQSSYTDAVRAGCYFGAGANYHLNRHYILGGELRYMMTDIENAPNDGMLVYFNVGYKY
jgi:hypothetical protein